MADFSTNATANVYVNNEQAKNRLNELTAQAEMLRKKLDSARLSGDVKGAIDTQKELKKVEKEANNVVKAYFDVDKVMQNLSKSGMNDLKKALSQLQKEINSGKIARGSKEWDEHIHKIKDLKHEIENIDQSMRIIPTRMERWANGFNRYAASFVTIGSAFYAIQSRFHQSIEDFAKMDDTYSDVMKTTQMTHEQVRELNKDFAEMDTRTSREQLNLLARDAGRLGLNAKKDVLEFVEAGNMINVALGEDLGDGAIKNIGKIVDVYKKSTKELQDSGLKENMLAVGSAINSIGQSSTASEAYLVEFAGRMGGLSSQFNISLQNILGYASALDQAMEKPEMAATAFGKLMTKIMSDQKTFAGIVGMDVKEFRKLVDTDMNSAILKVISSLNSLEGYKQMLPILDEVGLDASRAAEVISQLANSVDKVVVAQDISNTSFAQGTSIIDEYNVKNNNAQATLDKRKKAVLDTSILLGEKLMPVLSGVYGVSGSMLRLLPGIIDAVIKHQKAIMFLAIAGGVYVAGMKLQALWNTRLAAALSLTNIQLKLKNAWLIASEASMLLYNATISLFTGRLKDARHSMIAFNATLKTNPLSLFLVVLTAVAAGIYLLAQRTEKVTALMHAQANIQRKVSDQYAVQEDKINTLVKSINNENMALSTRQQKLNELKEIIPGYHAELTTEGKLINNNTTAINDYLVALEKQIYLKAIQEEKEELIRKKRLQEQQVNKLSSESLSASNRTAGNTAYYGGVAVSNVNKKIADAIAEDARKAGEELKATNDALNELDNEYQKLEVELSKLTPATVAENVVVSGAGVPPNGDDKTDPHKKELDALAKYLNDQKTMLIKDRQAGILSQDEYNRQLEYLENEHLIQLVEIYGLENEKGREAQDKLFQYRAKIAKDLAKETKITVDDLSEINKQSQSDIVSKAEESMNTLSSILTAEAINEASLQQSLTEVHQKEWAKRIEATQFALDSMQELMGGLSSYIQAENAAETAAVNRKYDEQIKAAGKNQRKIQKLEDARDKELKEVKRKNEDSSFRLQIAQALASTAQAALNAYSSTAAIPVIGPAAAPIAAAVYHCRFSNKIAAFSVRCILCLNIGNIQCG
ncbi:phage tail tape measure protein [Viscerimonas tarda]